MTDVISIQIHHYCFKLESCFKCLGLKGKTKIQSCAQRHDHGKGAGMEIYLSVSIQSLNWGSAKGPRG